ncbi:RNA-directed DNA polymerase, eukaryota, reverse transcriptase zinc-binding domain protein [Tanacetum coccineum]
MPPALTSKGLLNVCASHGRLVDAFITNKLSKGGNRFGFIKFLGVKDANSIVNSMSNIWIGSFHLYITLALNQFDERILWIGVSGLPLCAWGSMTYKKIANNFRKFLFFEKEESTALSSGRLCISTKSHQLISETVQVDIKKVDHESESMEEQPIDAFEILQTNLNNMDEQAFDNEMGIEGDKKDGENSCGTRKRRKRMWIKDLCLKHNVHFLGIQESKMTRLELFRIKSMWGNYAFDYACSMARGLSGGLISIWDPNMFSKNSIWCDHSFIIIKGNWKNVVGDCFMVNIYSPQDLVSKLALWNRLTDFMHHHNGPYIMFGDMNAVRNAQERFGTTLNSIEADHFNSFIDSTGLVDLPIGGRTFTWMNKAGTKLSKLDHFLISEDVTIRLLDVRITALDRLWSDHNPILLYIDKTDFGPSPFKLYNLWLLRDDFNNFIKEEWELLNFNLKCHEKFSRLKDKFKQWSNNIKMLERNRKTVALEEINSIEKRIDEGSAMPSDNDHRLILLQEIEKIDKFTSMDLIQKARVKWDIEGDENSKFFHGLINQKRQNQRINRIMVKGNWITNPCLITDAFLQFYKRKFQAQDTRVMFSNLPHSHSLNCMDRETLERQVTLEEIKEAV